MRVKKSHRDVHSHRSYIERSPPLKDVPQTRNNKKSTVAEAIRRALIPPESHKEGLEDPAIRNAVVSDKVMAAAIEAAKKVDLEKYHSQELTACQTINQKLSKWLEDHGEMPENLVCFKHPQGWQETERISRLKTLNSQKQRQAKAQGTTPMEGRNPRRFNNSGLAEKYITPATEAKRFNDWLRKQQALNPWTSEVDIYAWKGAYHAKHGGYCPPPKGEPSSIKSPDPIQVAQSVKHDDSISQVMAQTLTRWNRDLGPFVDIKDAPLYALAVERAKAYVEVLNYERWLQFNSTMVDASRILHVSISDPETFYKTVVNEAHAKLVHSRHRIVPSTRVPTLEERMRYDEYARYQMWLENHTIHNAPRDNIPILTERVDVGKPAVDDPPFDPPYETVNPEVRKEEEAIRRLVEKNWRRSFKTGNAQVLQAFYKAAYHRYWTPRLPKLIEETETRINANQTVYPKSESDRTEDDWRYYTWLMAKTEGQHLGLDRVVRIRVKDEDGVTRTVLQHRTPRDDKGATSGKSPPLTNLSINDATGKIGLNLVEGGTSAIKRSTSAVRKRPVHERIEPTLELPPKKLLLVTDPDVVERICDGHYDLKEFFNRINTMRVDTG